MTTPPFCPRWERHSACAPHLRPSAPHLNLKVDLGCTNVDANDTRHNLWSKSHAETTNETEVLHASSAARDFESNQSQAHTVRLHLRSWTRGLHVLNVFVESRSRRGKAIADRKATGRPRHSDDSACRSLATHAELTARRRRHHHHADIAILRTCLAVGGEKIAKVGRKRR